jgi:ribosomal protein L7/L12
MKEEWICMSCRARNHISLLSTENVTQINYLIKQKRTVEAIKETRDALQTSLKDAIDVVNELANDLNNIKQGE